MLESPPAFTIDASDPMAPEVVRTYAERLHRLRAPAKQIDAAFDLARDMDQWRIQDEREAAASARITATTAPADAPDPLPTMPPPAPEILPDDDVCTPF